MPPTDLSAALFMTTSNPEGVLTSSPATAAADTESGGAEAFAALLDTHRNHLNKASEISESKVLFESDVLANVSIVLQAKLPEGARAQDDPVAGGMTLEAPEVPVSEGAEGGQAALLALWTLAAPSGRFLPEDRQVAEPTPKVKRGEEESGRDALISTVPAQPASVGSTSATSSPGAGGTTGAEQRSVALPGTSASVGDAGPGRSLTAGSTPAVGVEAGVGGLPPEARDMAPLAPPELRQGGVPLPHGVSTGTGGGDASFRPPTPFESAAPISRVAQEHRSDDWVPPAVRRSESVWTPGPPASPMVEDDLRVGQRSGGNALPVGEESAAPLAEVGGGVFVSPGSPHHPSSARSVEGGSAVVESVAVLAEVPASGMELSPPRIASRHVAANTTGAASATGETGPAVIQLRRPGAAAGATLANPGGLALDLPEPAMPSADPAEPSLVSGGLQVGSALRTPRADDSLAVPSAQSAKPSTQLPRPDAAVALPRDPRGVVADLPEPASPTSGLFESMVAPGRLQPGSVNPMPRSGDAPSLSTALEGPGGSPRTIILDESPRVPAASASGAVKGPPVLSAESTFIAALATNHGPRAAELTGVAPVPQYSVTDRSSLPVLRDATSNAPTAQISIPAEVGPYVPSVEALRSGSPSRDPFTAVGEASVPSPVSQAIVYGEQATGAGIGAPTLPAGGRVIEAPVAPAPPGMPLPMLLASANGTLGSELGEKILWLSGHNLRGAEIQLDPPELGPLQIQIHNHRDGTSVQFTTHTAVARDAVESHLGRLRELLEGSGLSLVDVNVSQQQRQGQRQPEAAVTPLPALRERLATAGEVLAEAPRRRPSGLVDAYA